MSDEDPTFLLEVSPDASNWKEVLRDGHSHWTIRQARDRSNDGNYYRVTNVKMNKVLIMFKSGKSERME